MGLKKSKGSKSAPGPNLPNDPPGGLASGQSSQPEQPPRSQQAVLPSPRVSFRSHLSKKLKWGSRSPSPSPGVAPHNSTMNQSVADGSAPFTIAASASQSLAAPAQPHTSYSTTPIPQTPLCDPSPLSAGGSGLAVSPSDHDSNTQEPSCASASAPIVRLLRPQSEPIASTNSASSSTCAPETSASINQGQTQAKTDIHTVAQAQKGSTPSLDDDEPSSQFSMVWAKTLKIAKKKLNDNNLPPLNLTNFTPQSARENMQAVVEVLNTLQEDKKENRRRHTWCGKEYIIVERWGKTLKTMERYSPAVNTAIPASGRVGSLVWATVWTIMRVRISGTLWEFYQTNLKPVGCFESYRSN